MSRAFPRTAVPVQKCQATSKVTKKPCGRHAIPGGTVCHWHGGAAPQVQAAARARLAAMVDPALAAMGELLELKESPHVRLGAAKDILDRNGFKPPDKHEISGPDGGPVGFDLSGLTEAELLERHRKLLEAYSDK